MVLLGIYQLLRMLPRFTSQQPEITNFSLGRALLYPDRKQCDTATLGMLRNGREINYLTVFPSVAQGAGTAVGTQTINTCSLIQARMRVTLIDLVEAEGTSETHRAQAREGVDPINTRATIETRAEEKTGNQYQL
jgi:hypothetical protein